ncbi:hypothetical protein KM043_012444 [Ampulex compressa]|nr:hypothetical protein KM043_012444 [Ampulex compressa]
MLLLFGESRAPFGVVVESRVSVGGSSREESRVLVKDVAGGWPNFLDGAAGGNSSPVNDVARGKSNPPSRVDRETYPRGIFLGAHRSHHRPALEDSASRAGPPSICSLMPTPGGIPMQQVYPRR